MWLSKCTRAYKNIIQLNVLTLFLLGIHFGSIKVSCVNFTELRQMVCKLFKLSTNFLTVPRSPESAA